MSEFPGVKNPDLESVNCQYCQHTLADFCHACQGEANGLPEGKPLK
jgi:hypothetical protein